MIEIHILLAGVELGPFSEKQVRQYLAEGLVSPSDPAKYEGMRDWEAVSMVLANLPPPDLAPPPPLEPEPEPIVFTPLPPEPEPIVATPLLPEPEPEPEPVIATLLLSHPVALTPNVEPPPPAPVPISEPIQVQENPINLFATQKAKRKPTKIVIQPIQSLTPAPPAAKQPPVAKAAPVVPLPPITTPSAPEPAVTSSVGRKFEAVQTLIRSRLLPLLTGWMEKVVSAVKAARASFSLPPRPPGPLPPLQPKTFPTNRFDLTQPPVIYAAGGLGLLLLIVPIWAYFLTGPSKPRQANHLNATTSAATNHTNIQDPQTAADYCDRGVTRQAKGDLDGAIADYDQAILIDPKDPQAYYRRGLARQAKSDLIGALADFNQTLALDPKDADAYSFRGFVKQSKGDVDGAIADYTQALLINPRIAAAYYNRGLIKEQRGDQEGAIIDDNHALDIDPNMAAAYYHRGNAKNAEGNLDGAIGDYTQALALNPNIALAHCNRGFARQTKGDLDGALTDYTQALALNPKLAIAYYNRGLIKEQKNDLAGAIADSTRALELNPKDAQSYCNRGLARLGQGDLEEAMTDLKTFIQLAPTDRDADYARLYIWLISTEENPQGHADQDLADSLVNDWNSPPEDLVSKIARFLLGHLSESSLIDAAASSDPVEDQGLHCKAWYFAGMKRLLSGDKSTAEDYFRKSLATGQKDYCEYIFAQVQLHEIGSTATSSSN